MRRAGWHVPHPPDDSALRPDTGQLHQRLKQCLAQPLRCDNSRGSQPALAQTGPKRGLPSTVFDIPKKLCRAFHVLAEQKQPLLTFLWVPVHDR
jgi:hypothetical protein